MEQLRIEVIDRTYAAILAAKTPAERAAMANSAHRTARIMVESRSPATLPRLDQRAATPRILAENVG